MSVVLAIDTAAPRLQLAVLSGARLETLSEDMATGQAERLFPAIDALFARADVSYADLTRVAVTTGPGSFTGLRIGLSAARGLALALNIPVVGIGSLVAISLGYPDRTPLVVLLDAKRGQAYRQHFLAPGLPKDKPMLLSMEDALRELGGIEPVTSDKVDIGALARFARDLDPALHVPDAEYVRDADAKPQEKFRVARVAS